jgi:hypothetical protein
VILLLVVILLLLLLYPIGRIGLGDQVEGFPVKEMSLTVWNWTAELVVNVSGLAQPDPQYQEFIVLKVSLRNTATYAVYFGRNDSFNLELQQAKIKNLFLEATYQHPRYGTETIIVHSETDALDIGWGITLTEKPSLLTPNQLMNGSLYFIMHQGYTPKSLFCNDTNGLLFTVALDN